MADWRGQDKKTVARLGPEGVLPPTLTQQQPHDARTHARDGQRGKFYSQADDGRRTIIALQSSSSPSPHAPLLLFHLLLLVLIGSTVLSSLSTRTYTHPSYQRTG